MQAIKWQPRWREELVATAEHGRLVFELTMGSLHVYFPDEPTWQRSVPVWATARYEQYRSSCEHWCAGQGIPFTVVDNALVYAA